MHKNFFRMDFKFIKQMKITMLFLKSNAIFLCFYSSLMVTNIQHGQYKRILKTGELKHDFSCIHYKIVFLELDLYPHLY